MEKTQLQTALLRGSPNMCLILVQSSDSLSTFKKCLQDPSVPTLEPHHVPRMILM